MSQDTKTYAKGLDGVVAAESRISIVDGTLGKLYYYGYNIVDLFRYSTFEEVSYLLLYGTLPTPAQLEAYIDKMLKYRRLHRSTLRILKNLPKETHPMKALQTAFSALGGVWDNKKGSNPTETLLTYISQVPLLIAAYYRIMNDLPLVDADIDLSVAANFLYMLKGERSIPEHEEIFDKVLILHAEHGFCASTFTARVVASTLAPVSSSLSAAVGALFGPLHGGANEGVLQNVQEIGKLERVESWVDEALKAKRKIDGMGHRIYKVKDPRALLIEELLRRIPKNAETEEKVAILGRLESYFTGLMEKEGKKLYPNVDFYSGTLLHLLHIEPILFTTIFAIARTVGWSAHIAEQWKDNRIYRPITWDLGPRDLAFVPLAERH